MMKKVAIYAAAVAVCALMSSIIVRQHRELGRLEKNQSVLLHNGTVEIKETAAGRSAVSAEALTLRLSEMQRSNDSLLTVAKILGIKNRRLMEAARTASVTRTVVNTVVRDSVITREGRTDTLPCITYSDPWVDFSGCIRGDTFTGDITGRDTLAFLVHRVPKRFLFFRFGCKAVRLDVASSNIHTRLTYSKYIRLVQ